MKELMFTLNKHNAIWLLWLFIAHFFKVETLSGATLWLTLLGSIIVIVILCLYRAIEIRNVFTLLGYSRQFAEKHSLMLELTTMAVPMFLSSVVTMVAVNLNIELSWELKLFSLLLCLFIFPAIAKVYVRKYINPLQQ